MRVVTVVGARPQFIKAGPVSRALDACCVEEVLVHTGQHYDLNMSDVFFDALGLREPDHHLNIGSGTHGHQTGQMLGAIEDILIADRPDAVLVYGDTNSTLAGALAASKLHIPVVHVEAGLRSFNRRMPEEINRVVTDHLSALLMCPTDTAVGHLRSEGIVEGVHQVGDVMKDALDYWVQQDTDGAAVRFDVPETYYLATVHRAENVDRPERLNAVMTALDSLDAPVILPLHPRTRNAIGSRGESFQGSLRLVDPVGYLEMLTLERNARAILTDSGGVQKEAYMMGVPCITLRDETEWTETVGSGWNTLTGADAERIRAAVVGLNPPAARPSIFGDGQASTRIAQLTKSLAEGLECTCQSP